jgi:hypothetical protein
VFASNYSFDPENGAMDTRETLRIFKSLNLNKKTSEKVFHKNLEHVTGRKLGRSISVHARYPAKRNRIRDAVAHPKNGAEGVHVD